MVVELLAIYVLDAVIIFAPIGELVPDALASFNKGGPVVCGGIHMSEIPAFSYDLLWNERSMCSVANLTRQDSIDIFASQQHLNCQPQLGCINQQLFF